MFILEFFHNNPALLFFVAQAGLLAYSLYLPFLSGQLSLASPAFFAIGGYIGAIFSVNPTHLALLYRLAGALGTSGLYLLEFAVAALFCTALGIIVGILALRLRGIYLALATIALIEIVQVLGNNLTIAGGATGIFGIPRTATSGQAWILLAIVLLFVWRLEKTRTGRALIAIREDELVAESLGIRTTYYKVLAFTLGAALAGITGVLGAHYLNTWNPEQGTFSSAIDILSWVIVGGSTNFLGPFLGSALLTLLPELLRFLQDFRLVVDGLLLTLVVIFFPQGLAGLWRPRRRRA